MKTNKTKAGKLKDAPMKSRSSSADAVFHALGDPTRRALVEALCEKPQTVSGLAALLHISLAAVVQHLQVLEGGGLVRTEKLGRVRTCEVDPKGLSQVVDWVAKRRSIWEKRFDRLGDLLDAEDGIRERV
jgi:DNA-binding transcriptional ArsR family regulator